MMSGFIDDLKAALAAHRHDGARAIAIVAEWCGADRLPSMNSGSDSMVRVCWRMFHGATLEEAAAAEYVYRWTLPLNQWVNHAEAKSRAKPVTGAWPVPHLIGM
jgi:hypothetical protein